MLDREMAVPAHVDRTSSNFEISPAGDFHRINFICFWAALNKTLLNRLSRFGRVRIARDGGHTHRWIRMNSVHVTLAFPTLLISLSIIQTSLHLSQTYISALKIPQKTQGGSSATENLYDEAIMAYARRIVGKRILTRLSPLSRSSSFLRSWQTTKPDASNRCATPNFVRNSSTRLRSDKKWSCIRSHCFAVWLLTIEREGAPLLKKA